MSFGSVSWQAAPVFLSRRPRRRPRDRGTSRARAPSPLLAARLGIASAARRGGAGEAARPRETARDREERRGVFMGADRTDAANARQRTHPGRSGQPGARSCEAEESARSPSRGGSESRLRCARRAPRREQRELEAEAAGPALPGPPGLAAVRVRHALGDAAVRRGAPVEVDAGCEVVVDAVLALRALGARGGVAAAEVAAAGRAVVAAPVPVVVGPVVSRRPWVALREVPGRRRSRCHPRRPRRRRRRRSRSRTARPGRSRCSRRRPCGCRRRRPRRARRRGSRRRRSRRSRRGSATRPGRRRSRRGSPGSSAP